MANPIGESLLATVGVDGFFDDDGVRVTAAHRQRAMGLGNEIRRGMRSFLAEEMVRDRPLPAFSYRRTLDALTRGAATAETLAAAISGLDPEESQHLLAALGVAIDYLDAAIPRRSRETVLGPVEIPPTAFELSRFRRAHSVVQDPMLVIEEMREGALSREQVRAVEAVYPAVYDTMKQALFAELARLRAARAKAELPRRKALMVQALAQMRLGDPGLLPALERAAAQDTAERQQRSQGHSLTMEPTADSPLRRIEQR